MSNHQNPRRPSESSRAEAGFALILAMLCLMVLTMLGMTLATTTSTELQIATNYRWSQQAVYNAEAGIEIGKRYLQQFEWRTILPDRRQASTACANTPPDSGCEMHQPLDWTLARPGPDGEPSRNWEGDYCDTTYEYGRNGYGNVFDIASFPTPLQNTSNILGFQINGTFTLWVRRALEPVDIGGQLYWQEAEDELVLTAEGTAPYIGASNLENRAVRYVQSGIRRVDPTGCEDYSGQIGSGPTGSNYDQCSQIDADGVGSGLGLASGSVGEDTTAE